MTKQKKIIIATILFIVAAVIVYWVFIRKKTVVIDPLVSPVVPIIPIFPLKKGSIGKEVEQLQTYLVKEYGAKFTLYGVNGKWGVETDNNVQKWLKRDNVSEGAYTKWNLAKITTNVYK